jgi:hypothetical protein
VAANLLKTGARKKIKKRRFFSKFYTDILYNKRKQNLIKFLKNLCHIVYCKKQAPVIVGGVVAERKVLVGVNWHERSGMFLCGW